MANQREKQRKGSTPSSTGAQKYEDTPLSRYVSTNDMTEINNKKQEIVVYAGCEAVNLARAFSKKFSRVSHHSRLTQRAEHS